VVFPIPFRRGKHELATGPAGVGFAVKWVECALPLAITGEFPLEADQSGVSAMKS